MRAIQLSFSQSCEMSKMDPGQRDRMVHFWVILRVYSYDVILSKFIPWQTTDDLD